jgi:formate hydrogenlyase transcriptional activator
MRLYKKGIQALFPKDKGLIKLGAESYLAVPLVARSGDVMGHLALVDVKPMHADQREMSIFNVFAARARAELERKRAEERLANVLASAMDAIITIDGERRIMLFNSAAERVFGCVAGWAMGQPFDRFLSKRFRSLVEGYLRAADMPGGKPQQVWAPEGLTALRANREEFPIEATISPFESAGQRYYTVILRDINDRRRTEAQLIRLQWERAYLQDEVKSAYNFEDIVGQAPVMKRLFASIEQVALSDSTVLLMGETGTGKELIAHAIHNVSLRKDKLLVKLNCAALPSELIESELFGHEKGAFTGATAQRKGRFELADGGTLFLDEVGELSLPAQAKLLRVLQEQEFDRVGGIKTLKVDVRVIAATNRNLLEGVKAGTFRSDLYYRLNVFPLEVPPLRERRPDIPLLARHFLKRFARKLGKPLLDIAPSSMERLERYGWPGNIRELQNVIERAAVLARDSVLEIDDSLAVPMEA